MKYVSQLPLQRGQGRGCLRPQRRHSRSKRIAVGGNGYAPKGAGRQSQCGRPAHCTPLNRLFHIHHLMGQTYAPRNKKKRFPPEKAGNRFGSVFDIPAYPEGGADLLFADLPAAFDLLRGIVSTTVIITFGTYCRISLAKAFMASKAPENSGWHSASYFREVSVLREMLTMSNRPAKSGQISRPWIRLPVPLVSMRVKIFFPSALSRSITQQISSMR